MKWPKIQLLLGCLFAASIALSTVHPLGNPHAGTQTGAILQGAGVPQQVRSALELKCADCHSQNTRYPLYSHFAPVTWMIDRDIREGRKALDLSRWSSYTPEERINSLTRIASQVHAAQMPPRTYVMLHPHSRLSPDEQSLIYNWAKSERKLLRSQLPLASSRLSINSVSGQP